MDSDNPHAVAGKACALCFDLAVADLSRRRKNTGQEQYEKPNVAIKHH